MSEFLARGLQRPDREAIRDAAGAWTYGELAVAVPFSTKATPREVGGSSSRISTSPVERWCASKGGLQSVPRRCGPS